MTFADKTVFKLKWPRYRVANLITVSRLQCLPSSQSRPSRLCKSCIHWKLIIKFSLKSTAKLSVQEKFKENLCSVSWVLFLDLIKKKLVKIIYFTVFADFTLALKSRFSRRVSRQETLLNFYFLMIKMFSWLFETCLCEKSYGENFKA